MKILRVISSVNPKGGGPIEGVKQFQAPMEAIGVKVEVVCCDSPDAPWLHNCGLPIVHALGPSHMNYAYTPRLLSWLRDNASNYDAVIVEGLWQYHSIAVRKALESTNIPYFVFAHGMLGPWFKHTYPIKHFKKWLYWPWGEYRVLRDAHAVLFTCEEERRLASQSFWLYSAREVVTGFGTARPPSNGTKIAQEFLSKHPYLKGKRIVLFLGRLHQVKGCDLLVNAFAQVAQTEKDLHLLMAGPDTTDLAVLLKEQAEKIGIAQRITWTGMLRGKDKWGAINLAEVFCLSSHHENFGIVVAEALACGKPVLISNKVNIWREIESDAAGFVDEDTVDGTVRNLKRWLALDAGGYAAMSERARQCFASRFHIQKAAERLVEIIRERER